MTLFPTVPSAVQGLAEGGGGFPLESVHGELSLKSAPFRVHSGARVQARMGVPRLSNPGLGRPVETCVRRVLCLPLSRLAECLQSRRSNPCEPPGLQAPGSC